MARHNLGKKINEDGTLDDLGNTVDTSDLVSIDYSSSELIKSNGIIQFKNQEIKTENGVFRMQDNEFFINGTIDTVDIYSENKIELEDDDDLYYCAYINKNKESIENYIILLKFNEDIDGKTSYSSTNISTTTLERINLIGPESSNRATTKKMYFRLIINAGEYDNVRVKLLFYGNEGDFKATLEETAYEGKLIHEKDVENFVESEEFLENPAVPDPFANFYTKDETTALINEMTTGHKWDLLWEREYSAYNPSIDSVAVSSKKYDFYAIVYGNDNPQVKIISSLDSTVAGKRFYLTEMSLTQVSGKFTVNLNIRSARLDYSSNESWRYMYFGPAYSLNLYNGYYDNTVTADSACVPRKVYGFNVE